MTKTVEILWLNIFLLSVPRIKGTWLDPINMQNEVLAITTYSNRMCPVGGIK